MQISLHFPTFVQGLDLIQLCLLAKDRNVHRRQKLELLPCTKPKPTPAQIASSITRDTGSDLCWGWFGSGAKTTMHCEYRIKIVFYISAEPVKVLHECTLQWSSFTTDAEDLVQILVPRLRCGTSTDLLGRGRRRACNFGLRHFRDGNVPEWG